VLTDNESVEHYQGMADDPAFRPTFRQVCDLRDVVEIDVSAAAIRDLAQSSIFAAGVQRAFVAPQDALYGLARMLQAFVELEGTEIGVFRSMAEAEEWLRLPPGSLS